MARGLVGVDQPLARGAVEQALAEEGKAPGDATLDEMEALWTEAKARER